MRRLLAILAVPIFGACVPKVSLTVETRDPQGGLVDTANFTISAGRATPLPVNGAGTIVFIASADNSDGLSALDIEGGFSCNRITGGVGAVQQGNINLSDPALPGQHPKSSSFSNQVPVQCVGGTYTASAHACATSAKGGGRSCTKDASFQ